eukprot:3928983-Rhodomonas_salina.2
MPIASTNYIERPPLGAVPCTTQSTHNIHWPSPSPQPPITPREQYSQHPGSGAGSGAEGEGREGDADRLVVAPSARDLSRSEACATVRKPTQVCSADTALHSVSGALTDSGTASSILCEGLTLHCDVMVGTVERTETLRRYRASHSGGTARYGGTRHGIGAQDLALEHLSEEAKTAWMPQTYPCQHRNSIA